MCGIIGAVSHRDIVPVMLDGLRNLEYRGYDSAGIATISADGKLERTRSVGPVEELAKALADGSALSGTTALGHTRWATHGAPSVSNAHPLIANDRIAVVCNGIIENYERLRERQLGEGRAFESETDTEVIAHELDRHAGEGVEFVEALRKTVSELQGSYSIAAMSTADPAEIVVARHGSPLLVGIGDRELFIASDMLALAEIATEAIALENGDIAQITGASYRVFDQSGKEVDRERLPLEPRPDSRSKGGYPFHMLKEIHEQADAIAQTLDQRISDSSLLERQTFGWAAKAIFDQVESVQITACGSSHYAGMVAKHWFESMGIRCDAEISSEFRYRKHVVPDNALLIAISQSGETADTLEALREAKRIGFEHTMAICNSPFSSLVRETDLVLPTKAGSEICVASTKAFVTQLASLILVMIALARRRGLSAEKEAEIIGELLKLPATIEQTLELNDRIMQIAAEIAEKDHAVFLGRGAHYPIAQEGALKLKEVSYIHAEASPAGELKHGPLALIDERVTTVVVAPNNHLLDKLKSSIKEVHTRNGRLIVFSDSGTPITGDDLVEVVDIVPSGEFTSPIVHVVPLQLLAYHVGVLRGCDVDKPRSLAKSVTVE